MKTQQFDFTRKLIFVAVLGALAMSQFEIAQAEDAKSEDDATAQLKSPDSSVVSVGAGGVSGNASDRTLFGQYNGLRDQNSDLLLDVDIRKRDDATGTWTILQGRNLGLDDRELSGTLNKQGDWKVNVDYSELVRHDPRSINTGLANAGTTTPVVQNLAAPGTGAGLNLEQRRKGLTLGGEKWLSPNWMLEASFKDETKQGARMSGIGLACGVYASSNNVCGTPPAAGAAGLFAATAGALLMLPIPVDYDTKQFEGRLNYAGDRLKVNFGYYASFFSNANSALTPGIGIGVLPGGSTVVNSAGATLTDLMRQPMALEPDNQAQQLYVDGTYAFTPTTRATFKLAHSHATQHDDFAATLMPPAGVSNLGGVVDTNLAQIGLAARPWTKLSLTANAHYEDKDDKTPYGLLSATTNAMNSQRKTTGKLEASYQLPDNYRAILGVDYLSVHRDPPVGSVALVDPGFSAFREQTKEVGYRAELRRSMSETLNAAISFNHSKRDGSGWLNPALAGFPTLPASAIAATGTIPATLEDRTRDKVRLSAEWTPIDDLSLQFLVEDGKDSYNSPTSAGLQDSGMRNYGIDAAWKLSDQWRLSGYWNKGYQTQHVNQSIGYMAELNDVSSTVGMGVAGKPKEKLELGADLMVIDDSNRYQLSGGGVPDVGYRQLRLKLFGKYALEKNADLRIDLVHQRAKLDEWTWGYNGTPFAYSDNSSVSLKSNQSVSFVGVSYIYKLK